MFKEPAVGRGRCERKGKGIGGVAREGNGLGTAACCILSAEEATEGLENRARLRTEVLIASSGMRALAFKQLIKEVGRRQHLAGLPRQDPVWLTSRDHLNLRKKDGALRHYFSKASPLLVSTHLLDGDSEDWEGAGICP